MKKAITLLASALFSTAAFAQATPPAAAPTAMHAKSHAADPVEKHIKSLHDQLKITAAQESQWAQVAQTMRDNATQLDTVIQKRDEQESPSAIDDLNSYADLSQANSDGVKKMSAVFTPLYNSMSDDQKKNADEVFSQGHNRRTAHNKKAAPKKG